MISKKIFIQFLVKRLWPWILEYIWPIIIDYFIKIFNKSFKEFADSLYKNIRKDSNVKAAEDKAREAENEAQMSSDPEAREKYETIAGIWREVAEKYRQENEFLKSQIDQLKTNKLNDVNSELKTINPSLIQKNGNALLDLGDELISLPSPPNPKEKNETDI